MTVKKLGAFASGQVDGCFDGRVPEDFWRLLALYIAYVSISSLPWSIPFGDKEVRITHRQAREILGWHDASIRNTHNITIQSFNAHRGKAGMTAIDENRGGTGRLYRGNISDLRRKRKC